MKIWDRIKASLALMPIVGPIFYSQETINAAMNAQAAVKADPTIMEYTDPDSGITITTETIGKQIGNGISSIFKGLGVKDLISETFGTIFEQFWWLILVVILYFIFRKKIEKVLS